MNKVQLVINEHNSGINFKIQNINELDTKTVSILQNFAIKRNGYFRHDLAQFDIKRKLSQKDVLQIFELLELDIEVIEDKEEPKNLTSITQEIVDFGKYKGFKWADVPLTYLEWSYKENDNKNAYAEIKRRQYAPVDIKNEIIKFGKFKGRKWIDLPVDYLKWVLHQFTADKEAHKFSKLALEHQENT